MCEALFRYFEKPPHTLGSMKRTITDIWSPEAAQAIAERPDPPARAAAQMAYKEEAKIQSYREILASPKRGSLSPSDVAVMEAMVSEYEASADKQARLQRAKEVYSQIEKADFGDKVQSYWEKLPDRDIQAFVDGKNKGVTKPGDPVFCYEDGFPWGTEQRRAPVHGGQYFLIRIRDLAAADFQPFLAPWPGTDKRLYSLAWDSLPAAWQTPLLNSGFLEKDWAEVRPLLVRKDAKGADSIKLARKAL